MTTNFPTRIPNDCAIIWHETALEIPKLNEDDEALVLMYCHHWKMPMSGMCRIGWDGRYYLEWVEYNDEQVEVDDDLERIDYFVPDFWAYVNKPE
jgi:hypothetical protein